MSASRELRRRLRADRPLSRYEPCLPRPAKEPPAGPGWMQVRSSMTAFASSPSATLQACASSPATVTILRRISRSPRPPSPRYPARSCVVDGEAIVVDDNGLSVFDLLRYRRQDHAVILCAFDLIELDGEDLRREPIEVRKRTLKGLLRRAHPGIAFNRHFEVEGATVFRQACALGCEGIVSKRLGSPYRSGRAELLGEREEPGRASRQARGRGSWCR